MPGQPRRSTLRRWRSEGLPEDANALQWVFDEAGVPEACSGFEGVALNTKMNPMYEEKVISHENGHYLVQDWQGAIVEISDEFDVTYLRGALDFVTRKYHKFPVETPADWAEMKKRYDRSDASRLPGEPQKHSERPRKLQMSGPFWQLRDWLGMENLCIAFLDEPEFVGEMIDYWREFTCTLLEKTLQTHTIDCLHISEDMAYKAHSMISPAHARQFLMPVWKAWADICTKFNVPVFDCDSDGYIGELIPLWIEAGINVCDPIEVAAHCDINEFRRQFGKKMGYTGGVDKRALAAGGQIMRDEIMRIAPVVEDGGYIPGCDHGVPPDISLGNFVEYTRMLAELCGWR